MKIDIDIVSDAICPWCFVGKRRLEKALKSLGPGHQVEIRWKPFQLNPAMPRDGMSRKEYRERKFGSARAVEELNRRMNAVGAEEGIPFALDKIQRTPNTFDAHRLLWLGGRRGVQDAVAEGLFRAFFTEGRDVGDREVLADVAAAAGLDRKETLRFLGSGEGSSEVTAEEAKNRRLGVDAVPFFIVGGKYAIPGAQGPEVFLEAFQELSKAGAPSL